jgi:hypothetical protein
MHGAAGPEDPPRRVSVQFIPRSFPLVAIGREVDSCGRELLAETHEFEIAFAG